ncbi:MAG TPA: hypothetical protein VHE61_05100 [Opitutaceae bacterium]|nr:hypothetical protein [Opitutaceae bacterium]
MSDSASSLPSGRRAARSFWVWVVVACGLQLAGWVAWFIVTADQPVQEVPLATERG